MKNKKLTTDGTDEELGKSCVINGDHYGHVFNIAA